MPMCWNRCRLSTFRLPSAIGAGPLIGIGIKNSITVGKHKENFNSNQSNQTEPISVLFIFMVGVASTECHCHNKKWLPSNAIIVERKSVPGCLPRQRRSATAQPCSCRRRTKANCYISFQSNFYVIFQNKEQPSSCLELLNNSWKSLIYLLMSFDVSQTNHWHVAPHHLQQLFRFLALTLSDFISFMPFISSFHKRSLFALPSLMFFAVKLLFHFVMYCSAVAGEWADGWGRKEEM